MKSAFCNNPAGRQTDKRTDRQTNTPRNRTDYMTSSDYSWWR